MFGFLGTLGAIGVILIYIAINFALTVFFRRERPDKFNMGVHGVLPAHKHADHAVAAVGSGTAGSARAVQRFSLCCPGLSGDHRRLRPGRHAAEPRDGAARRDHRGRRVRSWLGIRRRGLTSPGPRPSPRPRRPGYLFSLRSQRRFLPAPDCTEIVQNTDCFCTRVDTAAVPTVDRPGRPTDGAAGGFPAGVCIRPNGRGWVLFAGVSIDPCGRYQYNLTAHSPLKASRLGRFPGGA